MTGPEHYREAQRLMFVVVSGGDTHLEVAELLALAQIHSTLALAAATALDHPVEGQPFPDRAAWREVAASPSPKLGPPRVLLPSGGTDG